MPEGGDASARPERQEIRALLLRPTGARTELAIGRPDATRDEDGVTWVDCARLNDWSQAAASLLGMGLGGLTQAALGHLFEGVEPAEEGGIPVTWEDPEVSKALAIRLGVRFVNAYWARAKFPTYPGDTPVLILCKVSFLVGADWVITNRVDGIGVTSGTPFRDDPARREDLESELARRSKRKLNGGDVATLMLRGLAKSYGPAAAKIEARLQNAELGFARRFAGDTHGGDLDADEYRSELIAMKWVNESMIRALGDLDRRGSPLEDAWFEVRSCTEVARETQILVEAALSAAHRNASAIRGGLDLLVSQGITEVLEAQRNESAQGARFERRLSLFAAVLIGPGLVAALFGAMPEILAGCWVARLALVLGLMAGAFSLTWELFGRPRWSNDPTDSPTPRSGDG